MRAAFWSGVEQLMDSLERHSNRFADVPKRHMVRIELAHQIRHQGRRFALGLTGCFALDVALSPTAGTASPVRMAPRGVRFTLANPARSFAATRQPLWHCSAQATTAETPEPPGRI